MEQHGTAALLRAWALALIALAVWALTKHTDALPSALGTHASVTEFSAGRAEDVLARLLGPERPHPATSPENAAVRARILKEYAGLGIKAVPYSALGCNLNKRFGAMECGTVTDVVADVKPGAGKALVLLAHYDSVPAGPGASDDESGDATIFETIRALKARGDAGIHPIIALHTDGEEFGLLGAASFLDNPAFKARAGAVINVEARGNQGPSLLFQTSPGDGPLIDLYAKSVPLYATSSLFAVVYKLLPNDTDLTLFIRDGIPSYNFAFSGNVAHYHTALDRRENLDPDTLQMHGNNMLGMASGLQNADFATLKGGSDDVYVTLFGHFLPRLPASMALPLSIFVFVLLIASLWIGAPQPIGFGGWLAALATVPALVIGTAALGWLLYLVAQLVSGEPTPAYAYPTLFRIALAFGAWGMTLLVSRMASARAAALGVWLFLAAFAIATAEFVAGLSPYFLYPLLIAAPLIFAQTFLKPSWTGPAAQSLFLIAALPVLVIWMGVVITGETVLGFRLHPLVSVPMAFALAGLVPVLAGRAMSRRAWLGSAGAALGIALVCAAITGLQPTYNAKFPLRLDVSYVEQGGKRDAAWAIDTDASAPLPQAMRATEAFSQTLEKAYPGAFLNSYIAPAGPARYPLPTAGVSITPVAHGLRRVTLTLHGSENAAQMALVVPQSAWLKSIEIDGKHYDAPEEWAALPRVYIACTTRDCADKAITLEIGTKKPVDVTLVEQRYGLPPAGAKIEAARPDTTVVSQNGDVTVLTNIVKIPGA